LTFNGAGVGENRDLKSTNVGLSHFAFVTEDLDGVIRRLLAAGFDIAIDGGNSPHRKTSTFWTLTAMKWSLCSIYQIFPANEICMNKRSFILKKRA
jgi:hypothetical protein